MKKNKRVWLASVLAVIMLVTCMPVYRQQEAKAAEQLYWPVPGHTALSRGLHDKNAIDISDSSIAGANVIAALGGKVTYIYRCGSQHSGSYHTCNGFGTGLVIQGTDGRNYQYAHMQAGSIPSNIQKGSVISSGQVIGKVGTTGNSTGNHLHFGICHGNYWEGAGNPSAENYRYDTPGGSQPSAGVTFQEQKITGTWETNAEVYVKVMNPNGTNGQAVSRVGCYLYNENGSLLKSYYEECGLKTSYVNYTCNFNNDMKYTLKPGTTYKYVLYAVVNGVEYKDSARTFKTGGTSDTSAPVISDVSVGIFDGEGYEVKCKVSDDVGVDRVQFPTWTTANEQDDIVPDWGTNSKSSGTPGADGYYTYRVNLSDHNNETGTYVTHIYAYDAAGNQTCKAVPDVVIPKYRLYFLDRGIDAVPGREACILEARITLLDAARFTSGKMITSVEKDGRVITQEKDLGAFTARENTYYYFEQLVDRTDFENASGTYTTTCILVDSEGDTTQASVSYDMDQLQDNLYAEATVGDRVDLKAAGGLKGEGWSCNMNQYYQKDIFSYVSEKGDGVVACNKAGRVYIIWENSASSEKYLQILDIIEKPVSDKASKAKQSPSGSNVGTSVNTSARSAAIKPPAKVRGVTLSGKKRALKAGWWYTPGCSGYQVVCSRSRKFRTKKTVYTKGISVKIRGLKRKKIYYVKVRAYTVQKGKKVYGKWSSVRKCRVR